MSHPKSANWPLRIFFASLIAVILVCIVFTAAYKLSGPASSSAAKDNQPAVVKVDQTELAKYWDDNFKSASWYGLTSMPVWDGNTLTAKTKLVADADAKSPAISICGALSGYFINSGKEFQSVRVTDVADQILVSRFTLGDECTWRR